MNLLEKQLFSYVIISLQGVYYNFNILFWKKGRCLMFYHYKFWHSLKNPTYFTSIVEEGEVIGYKNEY